MSKRDPMEIAEKRIEKARRTGATTLDLRKLGMTALPEAIGRLTALTQLDISGNQLTALPEAIGRLTALMKLDLGGNQLTALPEAIGRLTALTTLYLGDNQLTALPEAIGRLTAMTELYLSFNQLTALPEAIGRLTALTQLDLSRNQLTALPEAIGRLTALARLNLPGNQLTALPEAIGLLPALTELYLSGNQLTALPEAIGRLTALTTLYLNGNQLTALPEAIGRLTALTQLDISGNQLTALPEAIGRLTALARLNLPGNQLTALPEAIGQLTALTELNLAGNQLTALPEAIGRLTALTTLYLNGNQLTALPEAIGQLTVLTWLNLGDNQLTVLPEAIGRLTALTALNLGSNRLTALPEAIGRLTALKSLYLHGNERLGIPTDILGPTMEQVGYEMMKPANPADILAYYFRTRQGARPLNEAKIILLGRGEVGKTSLVNRLIRDAFDPAESITHGINITRWRVKLRGESTTLHVWDFGGQEVMHATHQFFLTERSLYLIVLNGRQGKEDEEAVYWLQLVKSFGGDSPVIVVLNKVGQHPFDVNRQELQRRYPNIKAFVKTDCADRLGIAELRNLIAREIDRLPHLRASFPTVWFKIKDRIAQMEENYLSFEKYTEICDELGETDPTAQEQLAGFLHALGIALHYRDDPRLNDRHVLNPHWVTGGIYALINAPTLAAQGGVLQPRDLADILDPKAYPRHMHRFLLDLMRKFDVCFALPDDSGRYLVPELLGKQEPAEARAFSPEQCLNFEYRYAVLPEGLLPRFIARTHWHSTDRPRWRTGVLLGFDNAEALVVADPANRRVQIRVAGPAERRRGLLALIRSEFDRIHADFKANPPEAWVPLPGFPDVAVKYRELLVREEKGRRTIEQVIGEDVREFDVGDLLNGVDLPGARRRDDRLGRERVKVFVSYSHRDETHKATLGGHLLQLIQEGLIHWWDDRHLRPGDDWAGDIDRHLDEADVILLLVSCHFLASNYCLQREVPRALERQKAGQAVVVPVILDASDTVGQDFMGRQVLPTDNKPILTWADPNDAWRQVASGLREVARACRRLA